MFVLGLVLILVSAGALVAVLASGTDDTAALYGGSVSMPTLVVFLLGAGALLVFVIGLELARSGVKRANQNRRDKRRLRKLERREELRRETRADGTDVGSATTVDGDADHASRPTTAPDPDADTTDTAADRPPVDHDTRSGPYQAPPPPSR